MGKPRRRARIAPDDVGEKNESDGENCGHDAMREMDRDRAVPVIGHEAAEHQREVGDCEPGARVAHRGADENYPVELLTFALLLAAAAGYLVAPAAMLPCGWH